MSILELARKVYNRQKAQRNGRAHPHTLSPLVARGVSFPLPQSNSLGEKSELSEISLDEAVSAAIPATVAETLSEKSPPSYVLVTDAAGLQTVSQALDESCDLIGLDTETTGLSSLADRVRLIQLATDRGVYLIDCFQIAPSPLWEALAEKTLVIHNAIFDLGFLTALGFGPGAVRCTMLLSQMVYGSRKGKGFHGLEKTAERELGRTISKAEQQSDWAAPILSREQLDYAAADAELLVPLHDALLKKLAEAGQAGVVEVAA
jgi:hypothetical protein